jgi:hypothetical protein
MKVLASLNLLHNGRIWVESPAEGMFVSSEFIIPLPQKRSKNK